MNTILLIVGIVLAASIGILVAKFVGMFENKDIALFFGGIVLLYLFDFTLKTIYGLCDRIAKHANAIIKRR